MRLLIPIFALLCFLPIVPAQTNPLARTRQLIVVTTLGWDAVDGTLQRYERTRRGRWRRVGRRVAVVVGSKGLGWGRGVVDLRGAEGPVKKEGDGKSPAGLFRLGLAFGYDKTARWRVPYRRMTATYECVDDSNSKYYNRIVDGAQITPKDWTSSEQMRRADEQYRWGLLVEHNYGTRTKPGGGSCIFLHIWLGAGQGTAGCTAMESARLQEIISWLKPAARPMLLQLPETERQRVKKILRWSI